MDDEIVTKSEESQSISNSILMNIDNINNSDQPHDENMKDKDYEQADEVDDETTMEEEEALPELEDPLREIKFLQEESNMPIHELMVMYGYSNSATPETSTKKKKKNKKKSSSKKSRDKKRKKRVSTSSEGVVEKKMKSSEKRNIVDYSAEENAGDSSSYKMSEETSKENQNTNAVGPCHKSSELLDLYMAESDQVQSGEDEDEDYRPHWEIHWKSVNVGINFQALVTDGLSTYGDVLPYENNDELLWDPNVLSEDLIEDYLIKIQQVTKALKPKSKTIGIRDNEKALYLLVQCGHDVAEAIRRLSLNAIPMEKSLSVWSEEETLKFELGLLSKGKDFHAIQKEVKTRSVAELVHFYYFWKKTERHDEYEKKKQNSLRSKIKNWPHWESDEDQDSDFDNMYQENSHEDSEDSVNAAENKAQMKCLIYADRKRQVRKKATNNACSNTSTNTN